jgi:PIN domain nuclease of toxin-antitoxin system
LQKALHDPGHVLQEGPVTGEITGTMPTAPRADIRDTIDRIIAATLHFAVLIISRDGRIRASNMQTVW